MPQVQKSLGGSPDILYLSAVLGRMKHQPSDVILGSVFFFALISFFLIPDIKFEKILHVKLEAINIIPRTIFISPNLLIIKRITAYFLSSFEKCTCCLQEQGKY